jgi:ATP-dependent Lon protease
MNNVLPIITTRGVVVFPGVEKIVEIGRPISLRAISEAMNNCESKLIIVSQKNPDLDKVTLAKDIYAYGTLVSIKYSSDEKAVTIKKILAKGISRVKLSKVKLSDNIITSQYKVVDDIKGDHKQEEGLKRTVMHQIQSGINLTKLMPETVLSELSAKLSGENVANLIANYIPVPLAKKQELLEEVNTNDRLKLISELLTQEKDINEIENTLNASMRKNLDKQQREFLLREKLKAIKTELGEISSKGTEIDIMFEKANSGILPDYVKEKILEEIKKFESMPSMAAEANVIKSFIE